MKVSQIVLGFVLPATVAAQTSAGAMSALSDFSLGSPGTPADKHAMDASFVGLIVFSAAGLFLL
ncbi:hypothetical protein MN608_01453 [Microdochium nivale]|nr:hypothetical protein MN608_01453 [Microdochium nivale]